MEKNSTLKPKYVKALPEILLDFRVAHTQQPGTTLDVICNTNNGISKRRLVQTNLITARKHDAIEIESRVKIRVVIGVSHG